MELKEKKIALCETQRVESALRSAKLNMQLDVMRQRERGQQPQQQQ